MKFDYSEEVDCGVALLNSIYPGWKKEIDLEKLNMALPSSCILGQLYGYYHEVKILHTEEYGFACDHDIPYSYESLTEEWMSRFDKTYNLSEENVKPGEYVVTKLLDDHMQEGFEVGSKVKVMAFCGIYKSRNKHSNLSTEVKNMVLVNDKLFHDCPVLVTPLKKD